MKKILSILCILFAAAGNMQAQETTQAASLSAGPWKLYQGRARKATMTYQISDSLQTALQFSLTLPDGITIGKDDNGEYACSLETNPLQWEDMGMASYREALVSDWFRSSNIVYQVPIQKNKKTPGLYRLVNPYGQYFPLNDTGDYDPNTDSYMVIDATDPEYVWVYGIETTMDWGYGRFFFQSYVGYYLSNGYDLETIKASRPDYFGTFEDGVITMPENSFIASMSDYNDGALYGRFNSSGLFAVALPSYHIPNYHIDYSYKECVTDEDGQDFVVGVASFGEDVKKAVAGLATADTYESVLAELQVGNGVEITSGEEFRLPIDAYGNYYVIIVPFDSKGTARGLRQVYIQAVGSKEVNLYIVGGPLDWSASVASKELKFEHSGNSLLVDPIFTITIPATKDGDTWFAIGDDKACDAITERGDWSYLFGSTEGNGNGNLNGQMARRIHLADEGSFKVAEGASSIRVEVNFMEKSYEITPLFEGDYIYEIGSESGWSTPHPLSLDDDGGKYVGYTYLNGEYKFKPNENNWDGDFEQLSGTAYEGTLTPDGGPNVDAPEPGFYRMSVDVNAMTYQLTRIEAISLIGTVNGNWDNDTELTYNIDEGCWETTVALNAGQCKLRANHSLDMNWGGQTTELIDEDSSWFIRYSLQQGGENMYVIESGVYTIRCFLICDGKSYCTFTKSQNAAPQMANRSTLHKHLKIKPESLLSLSSEAKAMDKVISNVKKGVNSDTDSHSLTVVQDAPNHYNFVCYSSDNTVLPVDDVLITLMLQVDDSVSVEQYEATIDKIILSDINGSKQQLETRRVPIIVADGNPDIVFADANVKALCVANWDTDGDGELGEVEAAAVTELGTVFLRNQEITSFNELRYFTGLTSIGKEAFYYCRNLTSITIPEGVASIGERAFMYCSGLTSITVSPNNPIYDSRNDCNAIIETSSNTLLVGCMNTEIPVGVTSIGNEAFYGCTGLTSIAIPVGVISIGDYAFDQCSNLASINIPEGVTYIGEQAFSACLSLTSVIIPEGITVINRSSFVQCERLASVVIPNSVTEIRMFAFANCYTLPSVNIPNSVKLIDKGAFYVCKSLTSLTIPESVDSIGSYAFAYCDSLESITVDTGNSTYDSRDNCNAIIETASNTLINGCRNTIIPESVTSIGNYAFEGFESLTAINIPTNVTSIGDYAFSGCGLTSLTIPANVTSIGKGSFGSCAYLNLITSHIEEPFVFGTYAFSWISDEAILYVPAGTRDKYLAAGWTEEVFKGGVVEMTSDEKVTLTINVEGMGAVMIGGVAYEDEEQTIEVAKGSNVVMQFVPETEVAQYILGKLTVNGEAVTDEVVGGVYVLREVEEDATVSAIFVEDIDMFVVDGIKYGVPDPLEPVVKVMMYDYGEVVNVPASVVYNDKTWSVKGIGSYAFYDCSELKWLSIPATVETIERNVIKKCPRLAAITWHPAMKMPTTLATSERNPNRLYYVTDMQWAPNVGGDLNIVVGTEKGTASAINLSDTEGNNDFYCPSAFTAGRISYRHYYAQHTQHRVCRGWESLVLPFDVADIRHEEKGTIAPFAALDEARIDAGEKPFWLYRYTEDGWARADKVEANVPYILSLPNEDFYEPEYRIGGYVTFEATNAQVQATTDEVLQGVQSGNLIFRPAFQKENFVSEKYLLNVGAAYNGHPEGSIFIRYFRGAHPFEGYFSQNGGAVKDFFSVFDEMLDGIEDIKNEELKDKNEAGAVYDLIGRKMSGNLPKGVYIQNGRKFTVK